jgi:glycosyltransferase involved in cell wall biosynthesis
MNSPKNKPLISIVTVVYNGAEFLENTIKSVINQTYDNLEYIIIDGGSTDGTIDIIKKYVDKLSYWISEPDQGIYDAMNKGIDKVTGDWINFMNTGDIFYSHETITEIFSNSKHQEEIIYGDISYDYGSFSKITKSKNINTLWQGMAFCHQSTFINSQYHKANKYSLKYSIAGDYDFLYKAFKQQKNFKYINKIVSIFLTDGLSDTNRFDAIAQRHKIINKYGYNLKYNLYYIYLYLDQFIRKITKSLLTKKMIERVKKIK